MLRLEKCTRNQRLFIKTQGADAALSILLVIELIEGESKQAAANTYIYVKKMLMSRQEKYTKKTEKILRLYIFIK